MYYLKNNKLGMTLIEMVISLVILGILMSATMGMIISSNNIFISTSKAALDRMVGNYVFQTIEKSTRYATHMKIADHTDALDNDYKQSFSLGDVQDAGTPQESGKLFVKTEKATEAMNLYGDGFYGNRTIQYKFEKVPNSDKHVHITVTVFREGKARFKREGTVKCVNLGLLASGMQANLVDDSAVKHPDAFNQTIYFSTNELIVSGGEDAWSLEYKVQEYMDGYNAILDEYTAKLIEAQTPLKQYAATANRSSARKSYSEYTTYLNQRNMAFFGVSSLNNFNSTIQGKNYDINKSYDANLALAGDSDTNNLRYQYQCKIYNYLGYSPLATYEYQDDVPSMISDSSKTGNYPNPYYGVVVTKEQLYAGFLFKYYSTDPKVGVKIEDYPRFDDYNTFFKDSIFAADDFDEQMVILSYFIESPSKGIVGSTSSPIVKMTNNTKAYFTASEKINYTPTWTTWSKMAERFGTNARSDGAVLTVTDPAAEGETPVVHNYSRAYSVRSTDGLQFLDLDYMKYNYNADLEGEEFLNSINLYDALSGDNFSGKETVTTWAKVVEKLTPISIKEYADDVSTHTEWYYPPFSLLPAQRTIQNPVSQVLSHKTGYRNQTENVTHITFQANKDIEQGWYYFDQGNDAGLAYAHHVFYLEAPKGGENPTDSLIAVKSGSYIDFYSEGYTIDGSDYTGYRYQQAKHTTTKGTTNYDIDVPLYELNSHNYADFIL